MKKWWIFVWKRGEKSGELLGGGIFGQKIGKKVAKLWMGEFFNGN